jgi:hypothetical protein
MQPWIVRIDAGRGAGRDTTGGIRAEQAGGQAQPYGGDVAKLMKSRELLEERGYTAELMVSESGGF